SKPSSERGPKRATRDGMPRAGRSKWSRSPARWTTRGCERVRAAMGARHSGREAALQMLFQMEATGYGADEAIRLFWRSFGADADPEGRVYAEDAVRGVQGQLLALDRHIAEASTHWRVERMTRVDRNVLRLGAWELAHRH